jgi:isopenicillin N synthase-like dioxygenase
MESIVPVIDMDLRSKNRPEFTRQLGLAFDTIGFARLVNHPVSPDLITRARAVSNRLYDHADEILKKWEDEPGGRQTGFTPFLMENARDAVAKNLMRFWHIRSKAQCDALGYPLLLPDLIPDFGPTMLELFDVLEALALDLLSDLDLYLGDATPGLHDMAVGGASLIRNIHYPAVGDSPPEGATRSAMHEDINLITLLVAATRPGLIVIDRDGNTHEVNEQPGEIVVDGGDMLQLATGGWLDEDWKVHDGRFKATTHGVRLPSGDELNVARHSMPFFVHPRPDAILWPARGVRQMHYINKRLSEIGVSGPHLFEEALRSHPISPWW